MTDHIDDVKFDVDGGYGDDGSGVKAFLILEGDFTETFEKYLADPNATSVVLEVSRGTAVEIVKAIEPYIGY